MLVVMHCQGFRNELIKKKTIQPLIVESLKKEMEIKWYDL